MNLQVGEVAPDDTHTLKGLYYSQTLRGMYSQTCAWVSEGLKIPHIRLPFFPAREGDAGPSWCSSTADRDHVTGEVITGDNPTQPQGLMVMSRKHSTTILLKPLHHLFWEKSKRKSDLIFSSSVERKPKWSSDLLWKNSIVLFGEQPVNSFITLKIDGAQKENPRNMSIWMIVLIGFALVF